MNGNSLLFGIAIGVVAVFLFLRSCHPATETTIKHDTVYATIYDTTQSPSITEPLPYEEPVYIEVPVIAYQNFDSCTDALTRLYDSYTSLRVRMDSTLERYNERLTYLRTDSDSKHKINSEIIVSQNRLESFAMNVQTYNTTITKQAAPLFSVGGLISVSPDRTIPTALIVIPFKSGSIIAGKDLSASGWSIGATYPIRK